jgi:hypothetical protein
MTGGTARRNLRWSAVQPGAAEARAAREGSTPLAEDGASMMTSADERLAEESLLFSV